ncbi:MAG TPA: hypothetical protein VF746_25570 [Longimicrobium sp.]|jgi:nicotinic acid mononucleotide adenylyltransferase
MKKVLRTVQPPHKSKTLTSAQARKAILKVRAEAEAKRKKRKSQENRPAELAP